MYRTQQQKQRLFFPEPKQNQRELSNGELF